MNIIKFWHRQPEMQHAAEDALLAQTNLSNRELVRRIEQSGDFELIARQRRDIAPEEYQFLEREAVALWSEPAISPAKRRDLARDIMTWIDIRLYNVFDRRTLQYVGEVFVVTWISTTPLAHSVYWSHERRMRPFSFDVPRASAEM